MATRKVLINRHTSSSGAPLASEMYLGEIAVAHETGKETLFTKNNAGNMVPFISCAQTISIVSGMIASVDVVYDVNKKEGEPYIKVETGETGNKKTFTLSTSGVASETNLNALSAGTENKIQNLTNILSALTDVVVTGISGDTIIVAEKVENGTDSNTYNLTHKQAPAAVAIGFNKLATDAYGHVTASTAVATEDIQALGFKTSAETGEDLKALSASVVTNKTNIEALSAGTQHDIEALSGDVVEYVKVVSGNIETVINELSAGTKQLSADTHNTIVKLSGDTEAAITAAIQALDSEGKVSAAGKYLTGIGIADGKISGVTEADIPVLSVVSAGTGNVVSEITVNDHKITYQTVSVATSEDINKLSAATIALSAGTVHDIEELSGATQAISGYAATQIAALSAGTIQLSADTKATIEQLSAGTIMVSGYAHGEIVELSGATVSAFTAILGMDKAADAVAGQVVTTVAETDGVVSETKANVKDLQLGGYVKDTTATGDIASTDTINAALSKLENKAAAITIANADGSINVTTGATGTDINVEIKANDPILAKDGGNGVYSTLNLVKITTGLPETVKERYELQGIGGAKIGEDIDVPKDSHIVSITYITDSADTHYQNLEYKYIDASGVTKTEYVDMSELVIEAEFKSGVTSTNGIVHGVVDSTSESFLTVGADGFKLSGVQDAIDAKVNALDVTGDTAAAGQYVAAIQQTDGVVAVKTRANVSEAVLNNYAKGTDATPVAATDTVNQAISKLENQIDAAKDAATTKVVEGTDAGNNMTIVSATGADSSVTYTINLTDVASASALTAEIAARKAVDGQNGDTYAANTGTNFISDATSLNNADVKLDAAIKTLSGNAHDAMIARDNAVFSSAKTYTDEQIDEVYASAVSYADSAITYAIEGLDSVGSASTTGHYLTSVTITDGKISAVGEQQLPAATPVTTVNGTTGNTAAAVIAEVVTGGTEGHQLTLNYSNKVFSATTAESAVTSQSAQTSVSATVATNAVHASAATKVDSALTLTDVAGTNNVVFDGSANKTVTFGTATSIANENSMTMSNAGVVDVNIIDCGEY